MVDLSHRGRGCAAAAGQRCSAARPVLRGNHAPYPLLLLLPPPLGFDWPAEVEDMERGRGSGRASGGSAQGSGVPVPAVRALEGEALGLSG